MFCSKNSRIFLAIIENSPRLFFVFLIDTFMLAESFALGEMKFVEHRSQTEQKVRWQHNLSIRRNYLIQNKTVYSYEHSLTYLYMIMVMVMMMI